MSRIALIERGVVENVVEAEMAFAQSLGYDYAVETDVAAPGWTYDGEFHPPADTPGPQTLDELKQQLKARTTELRWELETGGVEINGVRVLTGIEDQNRIATALIGAPATLDFKAESGWVTLTLAELQGIAAVITAHVQACFTAERLHHGAIDALETLDAAHEYDVEAGWPTAAA